MNIQEKNIIEVLKQVKDPEIGIDIWTLGLIYKITITDEAIDILMTLTSPMCPFANDLITEVEEKLSGLGGLEARVDITFDPPWEPSDELRAMLGI